MGSSRSEIMKLRCVEKAGGGRGLAGADGRGTQVDCSMCAWAITFGFINTPPVCGGDPSAIAGSSAAHMGVQKSAIPIPCVHTSIRQDCHPGGFHLEPPEVRGGRLGGE